MMQRWIPCVAGVLMGCLSAAAAAPVAKTRATSEARVTADQALARMKAGNARFRDGNLRHPDQGARRRLQVEPEQHPFAVVVSCSDSRVPPEIIFDEGLGDLFVVREAGHVAADATLGSIEYAVEHLHARLVVVLGHEHCGAVSAAVDTLVHDARPHGHILTLVDALAPAIRRVRDAGGDLVSKGVRANVDFVVESLRDSHPIIAELVREGSVKVVGGVYDLHTGTVEWR